MGALKIKKDVVHFSIFRRFGNDIMSFFFGCMGEHHYTGNAINTAHLFDRIGWCVGWCCILLINIFLLDSNDMCDSAAVKDVMIPLPCVIMVSCVIVSMCLLGAGGATLFIDFMDCFVDYCKYGTIKHKLQ